MPNGRKAFCYGIVSIVVFLIFYAALYEAGFDERSERKIGKVMSDCEINDEGLIRQPTNAITGLAICIPALVILWRWDDYIESEDLPFQNKKMEILLYVGSVLAVAFGAALSHGTKMKLAGQLDTVAMIIWILIPMTWALIRVLKKSPELRLRLWVALSIIICSYTLYSDNFGIIDFYLLIIPIWIILEIIAHFQHSGSINRWTIQALFFFCLAYVSRTIGERGSTSCNPESMWQWHGVWHLICIYVIWCIWMHIIQNLSISEE